MDGRRHCGCAVCAPTATTLQIAPKTRLTRTSPLNLTALSLISPHFSKDPAQENIQHFGACQSFNSYHIDCSCILSGKEFGGRGGIGVNTDTRRCRSLAV